MKSLTPIILIAISVGVFFLIIDPEYKKVQGFNETIQENDKMLDLADELRQEREKLQAKFASISDDDKDLLKKVLPDTVDNVRLLNDFDNLAKRAQTQITNISIEGDSANKKDGDRDIISSSGDTEFGTISLGFSVVLDYEGFEDFMKDLEDSQRLVDITSFSVSPAGSTEGGTNLFNYKLTMDAYWLR